MISTIGCAPLNDAEPSPAPTKPPAIESAVAASKSPPPETPSAFETNPPVHENVEVFVDGLAVPWAIDFAPDGRIFLTERAGRIRLVKGGQLQRDAWMTLEVAAVGEAGLLGFALDPGFARNGFAYAAYTYRASNGRLFNRLVRLREDAATGKGAVDKVLLDSVPGNNLHDGGRVKLGPDGKLYWTMGELFDGQQAQDLTSLNGKILRLNIDGSIPADNPFPNSPIYSYGHRNPQGLAWQPGTGRLYETEHGPSGERGCCRDEVNLIEPGKNYGWPVIAGNETRQDMVSPILQSGPTVTWAPSGAAFVTRGPWSGSFLFAGLAGEALYRLILDPKDPRRVQGLEPHLSGRYGRLRDVAEGPDGALYILTNNLDGRGKPTPDGDKILRLTFVSDR